MAKRRSREVPNYGADDDADGDGAEKTPAELAADAEDAPPKKTTKKKAVSEDEDELPEFPDDDNDDPPPKAAGPKKPKPIETGPRVRTHSLDDSRKLTKKDKANLAGWKDPQKQGKLLDTFLSRQAEEARKKFGHKSVFLGSQTETLVVGIPTPAFAFEYVTANACFPLGLVHQIVAKHGIGKSALLAEIGRWFDMAGGGLSLCENETKFNPFWYSSILGDEAWDRTPFYRCTSVEDWQKKLTWGIQSTQSGMLGTKEAPGPGKAFPVVYGVDSIMGKMSEENQEKILGAVGKKGKRGTTGEGFAQARSYPIEAGSITKYMRTIPQIIDNWPFSLVLINHLRNKTDDNGNPERNKTGGEQVNFQESFELELKKMGGHKKKISTAQFEGIPLELSCEKNSFGPTGRKANVRLLWWYEKNGAGESVQKSVWDWDWATTNLLSTLLRGENSSPYLKARLKEMDFHLETPTSGDFENTAWSKSLGMKADDALTWSEVGAMIREDTTLLDNLRDALGIMKRPMMAGDYSAQKQRLAEDMP